MASPVTLRFVLTTDGDLTQSLTKSLSRPSKRAWTVCLRVLRCCSTAVGITNGIQTSTNLNRERMNHSFVGEFYGINPRTANVELVARFFEKYPSYVDITLLSPESSLSNQTCLVNRYSPSTSLSILTANVRFLQASTDRQASTRTSASRSCHAPCVVSVLRRTGR